MRKVQCVICNTFFETESTNQKYCCEEHRKIGAKKVRDAWRKKQGVTTGVGSGNNQGRGKTHHTYKNGSGIFRRIKLESMTEYRCELCSIDLSELIGDKDRGRYFWCVHHKDGNRKNNSLSNLELLCKRCHQLIHNCEKNLPQNLSKV